MGHEVEEHLRGDLKPGEILLSDRSSDQPLDSINRKVHTRTLALSARMSCSFRSRQHAFASSVFPTSCLQISDLGNVLHVWTVYGAHNQVSVLFSAQRSSTVDGGGGDVVELLLSFFLMLVCPHEHTVARKRSLRSIMNTRRGILTLCTCAICPEFCRRKLYRKCRLQENCPPTRTFATAGTT